MIPSQNRIEISVKGATSVLVGVKWLIRDYILFCRLCAVFEGTYILEKGISSFTIEEQTPDSPRKVVSIVTGGQTISCHHLVMEGKFVPKQVLSAPDQPSECVSRAVLIVSQ